MHSLVLGGRRGKHGGRKGRLWLSGCPIQEFGIRKNVLRACCVLCAAARSLPHFGAGPRCEIGVG
eukprot:713685-Alexandrium_andersonii.AAC.1